ncbi:MAG TPA: hypothetical protein VMY40_10990 [Anaerolineae bacterium]|nr:hypothetical protein [Anaerolineae bacterium]
MPVSVTTAVKEALKIDMPRQIGPGRRWEEALIDALTTTVAREVAEYCELVYTTQEISAVDDTAEYALGSNCIEIYQVEWASDGSTYDTILKAVTMEDLDNVSRLWRDDTGTWPARYTVTSTPGVPAIAGINGGSTYSTIIVHPKVSTAGSATLRVRFLSAVGVFDQHTVDGVVVPYMKALLYASSGDQKMAKDAPRYYAKYLEARENLKQAVSHEYAESLGRIG